MFVQLRKKLGAAIAEAAGVPPAEAEASIIPSKGGFGDFSSSISFSIAKARKKNPAEVAREVAGKIRLPDWAEHAKADGPYLNFLLSSAYYAALVGLALDEKERFGQGKKKKTKTMVEFPSVNPNKPWHIGHLRNALLGDSVSRLLEFSGERVERTDYIDDLGLQVAQSFWSYLRIGNKPAGKLDHWLGEQYVEVSRRFEADENVQQQVRGLLRKMEEGGCHEARQSRKLVEECVGAQYETAFMFGIYHDLLIFESDIMRAIFAEGMEKLRKSSAIRMETDGKNKGCLVAKMDSPEFANMESPDKILIRSDGTATYTGKDVIFQMWKFGLLENDFTYADFMRQPNGHVCRMSSHAGKSARFGKADRVVNVIGMEQAYPQKVIKEIMRSMGYAKQAENSLHLDYEHVGLADAKFSGRQGTWLGFTADELYAEGMKRAESKIKEEVTGDERGRIATAVAAAAIRFAFLKTTPEKKITFSWDIALSLEGDSAPYVMYAHARAHKIFSKAGAGLAQGVSELSLAEKELLNRITVFGQTVSDAARQMRPHIVAEYCLDVATLYNKFYNACPVISCDDPATRSNRLAINYAALVTMKNALAVLGIEALEKM